MNSYSIRNDYDNSYTPVWSNQNSSYNKINICSLTGNVPENQREDQNKIASKRGNDNMTPSNWENPSAGSCDHQRSSVTSTAQPNEYEIIAPEGCNSERVTGEGQENQHNRDPDTMKYYRHNYEVIAGVGEIRSDLSTNSEVEPPVYATLQRESTVTKPAELPFEGFQNAKHANEYKESESFS